MAIFKALSKKEESSKKESIYLMYYFIQEIGVHYCKLIDETNSILFENTDLNILDFFEKLDTFLNENFVLINWIGETKFDEQTNNLLNKLKNK